MKRVASGILGIVIMLCAVVFIPAKAEAATNGKTGSCTWSLNGTVLTISGSGKMASYSPLNFHTNAPWGYEITHVVIENGVTNIGQYAFYGCSKLQSVSIPGSVKQIDKQAFDYSGLKSLVLPEGLTKIYDGAFNQCTSLYSVVLPNSLTYIGDWAFQSCKMTGIVFSKNLKYIGYSAFNYGCIKDVWYLGNRNDKAGMTIGDFNACLSTATWHYDSCPIGAPHSYDNDCDANCNGCGLSRTVPEHVYDNTCDPACNVCGTIRDIEHQFDNACDTKCSICQEERVVSHFYDDGKVTQKATCGEIGVKTFTCTACGATKTEDIPKTSDHKYGNWLQANDTQHKNTCSICAKKETADHTWDGGQITVQPSCKESGGKTYTCSACNGTKNEAVAKTSDHKYGSWIRVNDDQHKRTCSICSGVETVNHNWNSGMTTRKATCKETGIKTYTCVDCGGNKNETIPKLLDHLYDNDCDLNCNICGAVRSVSHKYTNSWSKDETNHWCECSECGNKKDVAEHTPGTAATETTAQKCSTCNYIIKPALSHVHEFSAGWEMDRNGHWHSCPGCEEKNSYAVHMFENACDTDCTICGFERTTLHSFTETYKYDNINHWYECSACGEKKDINAHEPGPNATETTAQTCTICAYEISPALTEPVNQTDPTEPVNQTDPTEGSIDTPTNSPIIVTNAPIDEDNLETPWWVIVLLVACIVIAVVAVVVFKKKEREFEN